MSTTTDGRSARWDDHRQRRREELVEGALRAIRERGAAVGMDDIAAAAGTSKTVYYRHFTDRNGLYQAIADKVDAIVLRDVTRALGETGTDLTEVAGDPRRLVAAAIDSYLALVEKDPEVYRFIVSAPLVDRSAGLADPAQTVTGRIEHQIAAVITAELQAQGADVAPAAIWGTAIVGLVRAAADGWIDRGPERMPRQDLCDHLTTLAWGGLGSIWKTRKNT
ncbi:TetR/AcrR family transcriptional regulator [Janibacter sp. G1551]|uniref:TetR/AcrR family transcriptional regulator n=1 Tax=Janibacter sp. G1551 TaxID=3420440 RepID=UPI003CFFBFB2